MERVDVHLVSPVALRSVNVYLNRRPSVCGPTRASGQPPEVDGRCTNLDAGHLPVCQLQQRLSFRDASL